ncbi:MAG: ABC transporter ATP-binding protein [Clostridium sp.]|nr:ABC transporter ATP-binding protein [Clostridium sp.]
MKRIMKYFLRYKILVIIPSIAMFFAVSLDLINPYIVQNIIDKVIIGKRYDLLPKFLIFTALISIGIAILGYIKEFGFDYMSTKVNIDIRKDLFSHIQSLSFSYFDNMNTGELMSRMSEDIENIWRVSGFGVSLIIENTIYFVLASIILFYLNWVLALVCLITLPFLAYVTVKLKKQTSEVFDKISDETAILNTTAQENIAGVRLVKAFAREKHEILKFFNFNNTNYELNVKVNTIWGKYNPLQDLLGNISVLLVICIGGMLAIKGKMTIGTLVAFSSYVWMLIQPIRTIGALTNLVAQSSASAKKIDKIMNTKPEIRISKNAVKLDNLKGDIEFKNVSFKYKNQLILKDINLKIPAKSTVAIMGATGAGKSSLVSLIGRYYDVLDGELLIDGINIKNLDLKFIRKNMSIVPQDTFLFSDTVENNLKFSKTDASMDEIIKACTDSCAINFIENLENGFDTIIGERGIGLSGGQKQRLTIARALIRDSKILILDDATSALDMETEYNLLKNLYKNKEKNTTLIIAHRISAVKNADLILFLEKGRIVESGTHDELLAKKGHYYRIYSEQFKSANKSESKVI